MLILASASPRRKQLMGLVAREFEVVVSDTDENVPPGLSPAREVELLARRKALAVLTARPDGLVIGADTLVALDGETLGKPRDEAHAADMLRRLSGRRHEVYTGVAVADKNGCDAFVERAEVEFAPLDDKLITAYIATGEPMDKAGAYGIQGRGALLVRAVYGDFYTVMGLPVHRLAFFLAERHGFPWNL